MDGFQQSIVSRAQDVMEDLTEWEAGFIHDLAEKPYIILSEKQKEILNRIAAKLDGFE